MHRFAALAVLSAVAFVTAQSNPSFSPPADQSPDSQSRDNQSPQSQSPDEQAAAASPTYQAFLQEVGGTWVSQWCAATGTPKSIYGTGLPVQDWRDDSLAEAERHANWAVDHFRNLFGVGASTFRLAIAAPMGNTYSFTYEQYFQGLPVIGGRIDLRVHHTGAFSFLGSTAWPVPGKFNVAPAIDETNAMRIAAMALGTAPIPAQTKGRQNRLCIWGDIDAAALAPLFLAWEVPVSAVDNNGNGPVGRYYVDARTGAVLRYVNEKHACGFDHVHGATAELPGGDEPALPPAVYTVQGWTRTGLSATATPLNIPLVGVEVNVPGVGILVTDVNGQFTANLALPTAISVVLNGIHCTTVAGPSAPTVLATLQPGTPATLQFLSAAASAAQLAHTDAYYWVFTANEWVRSILGNTSQMSTLDSIGVNVNASSTCNAFFSGSPGPAGNVNFYVAGGGCNNTAYSTVIAHEWGHGLDNIYGGISNNVGDGLSEGWGDIVAMYLVNDPIIGRDFTTGGGFIRTGLNTTQYGVSTQDVHLSGESWMGFAWQFRINLVASVGATLATSISNTDVIGSIVANAQNQHDAVQQVFIADDNDANLLNGTPHYNELSAAATFHGLPYPQRQLVSIAHTPIGYTNQQLTPRVVKATVSTWVGSITSVNLVFNDGVQQTRAMVPTGLPDEYMALLPGHLAPSSMAYHIEVMHNLGAFVRLPASGENPAPVTADTVFYSEDFETNGPGWTHGFSVLADDWQVGAPQGRSGSSLGIAWSDPAAAFSGANCYGNDLGIGGSDGAYNNSETNYLRSPVINCSGRTNVRLRFARWLTCEQGIYDHAAVLVNGATVWLNPAATNTVDTAWQQIELPIPSANNNAAVQLSWTLQSDVGLNLGGWNIDSVQLVAAGTPATLVSSLTMLPEQQTQGLPINLAITTPGQQIFALVIGDTAGPLLFPGVPPIQVGGSTFTIAALSDPAGSFGTSFMAPAIPGLNGVVWYSQVATLDGLGSVVLSNPNLTLFVH
jgi:hypothetical protein